MAHGSTYSYPNLNAYKQPYYDVTYLQSNHRCSYLPRPANTSAYAQYDRSFHVSNHFSYYLFTDLYSYETMVWFSRPPFHGLLLPSGTSWLLRHCPKGTTGHVYYAYRDLQAI
jgi:hypothetical protein